MEKLLVATDGTERSLSVLPHAGAFASTFDLGLTLLRLVDAGEAAGNGSGRPDAMYEEMEAALRGAGLQGDCVLEPRRREERTEEAIARVALEVDAAAVALQTFRSGAIRHAVQGSVTMGVLQRVDCPVLATGPRVNTRVPEGQYRVVVATDGAHADRLIERFGPVLERTQASVTLLNIFQHELGERPEAMQREACRERLEELRRRFPPSVPTSAHVGDVGGLETVPGAIVREATDLGASAIALATNGHKPLRHLLSGSTALGVLQRSPLPVVLCRAE